MLNSNPGTAGQAKAVRSPAQKPVGQTQKMFKGNGPTAAYQGCHEKNSVNGKKQND
jgi:hypothetical protein